MRGVAQGFNEADQQLNGPFSAWKIYTNRADVSPWLSKLGGKVASDHG